MSSDNESGDHSEFFQCILNASGNSKKAVPAALKPYHKAARWIALAVNPFVGLTRILYAGLEMGDAEEVYTEEEWEINEIVMGLVPGFRNTIMEFVQQPEQLETFVNLLNRWSNEARHEDTGSIKFAAIEYIPRNPSVKSIDPPITRNQGKSVRGFNHPATARLLCPFRDLKKFDANPEDYMEQVKDGKIKITGSTYPTFMYDEDAVTVYDPKEIDKGLCRGYFILRLYRHIFTGPSSALQKVRKATKRSKADIHSMSEVTGRTIAYARVMLGSTEQWSITDGDFNLESLYNMIVRLFEHNPTHPWVLETLAFWNQEVPSLKNRQRRLPPPQRSSDTEVDEVDSILAQRRARGAPAEIPAVGPSDARAPAGELDDGSDLGEVEEGGEVNVNGATKHRHIEPNTDDDEDGGAPPGRGSRHGGRGNGMIRGSNLKRRYIESEDDDEDVENHSGENEHSGRPGGLTRGGGPLSGHGVGRRSGGSKLSHAGEPPSGRGSGRGGGPSSQSNHSASGTDPGLGPKLSLRGLKGGLGGGLKTGGEANRANGGEPSSKASCGQGGKSKKAKK